MPTRLNIPYKSQLDNVNNPTGSCNVTSIAMALAYLGCQPLKPEEQLADEQLEDEMYLFMLARGLSRHSPQDLAKLVNYYGYSDDFTSKGTIKEVQEWLASGNPCVIHGYFTSYGHIVCLTGFDDKGFWVHDPYGEWFSQGYRTDLSGKHLHYSYDLIKRTCMPDGDFWVHFISK